MRSLRNWLLAHRPDLIYVSMLKHDAYVAVGVGQALGIPVVLRPEGAGETGDLAWQAWGRFGRKIGERCKLADAFVAISPAIHAELVAGGYDEAKIHDIPNGVPVPETPWAPWCRDRRTPRLRVAFVGRLAPEKNLATLLDAWPIVLKTHPGARLMLIGDGPERPALEAKAAALGLSEVQVTFAGACPDPTEPAARQRPVRPPVSRRGDEHRPAGSDGAGHPDRRLRHPRQPPIDRRRRPRPARPAG